MSYLEDILASINAGRAQLTQPPGVSNPDAGEATPAADPSEPVVTSSTAQESTHSPSQADRLAKALKTLHQNEDGKAWAQLTKFGGKVLGYGHHEDSDTGHTGRFAIVQRDGKLFHLYRDGTLMKMQMGQVARSLGIKEPRATVVAVPGHHGAAGAGNGTGGAQAPAGGGGGMAGLAALTGGAQAPDAISFRGQQPGPAPGTEMEGSYSRGPASTGGVPPGLQYLLDLARRSGGTLAP